MPSSALVLNALVEKGHCVWSEQQLVGRREFHASEFYQKYQRAAGVADILFSSSISTNRDAIGVGLLRSKTDREFNERELGLLAFIGNAVSHRTHRILRLRHQHGRHHLTARQRETLEFMLQGYSEKKIAQALRLKTTTVHEYIGATYRALGVTNRAELMAMYIGTRLVDPDSDTPH
jgi:DNA-binding NarL/FixJ family response regulator